MVNAMSHDGQARARAATQVAALELADYPLALWQPGGEQALGTRKSDAAHGREVFLEIVRVCHAQERTWPRRASCRRRAW